MSCLTSVIPGCGRRRGIAVHPQADRQPDFEVHENGSSDHPGVDRDDQGSSVWPPSSAGDNDQVGDLPVFDEPKRVQSAVGSFSLVEDVLGGESTEKIGVKSSTVKKKGAFSGVFVPTCENMWGVLIFLRFYLIVGEAGVVQALLAVFLSFSCAFCTITSMTATVSSGGVVSQGGPYYMISRALGPSVGASVGIMYWLAITMLAVLETLGAVEGILMISDKADFPFCKQAYGSVFMVMLCLFVNGGINLVSKLGIFFVFIVFATLFMFYFGLILAPNTPQSPSHVADNPYVTGLDWGTLADNLSSHYSEGKSFGYVLSVFFPCFTGILSGANRADILKDPPRDLKVGTFGAITFSLVMYSSYMILWGCVAHYPYLQGQHYPPSDGRRLAGAAEGTYIIDEIVWNPFPHAAKIGIIISSLSQALQCLVVAPRLLNAMAKDKILKPLNSLAPLRNGEPKRALAATYVVSALLVLLGKVDIVAPLLSMCFLVAYAFMNFSCFALTWLRPPAWRPKGITKKRWRCQYLFFSFMGFLICLTIMFTIDHWWAIIATVVSVFLYALIDWQLKAKEWGSATDGIRHQLALKALMQLEESQNHHVNWRPQLLVLYRIDLDEEQKGNKNHNILRFSSQLRKGNGFVVVACVLEAEPSDEHALRKAKEEKVIIQRIMKEEGIKGFSEVVVAPSWGEGTSYIIQLTGIGGLVPNTVLVDWPIEWAKDEHQKSAKDFVNILKTSLAEDKAVLAVRGLADMPTTPVFGTIDIWWMIHDGGFLILLSWLLKNHKIWRQCHLRVFTIAEGVTADSAMEAAGRLTKTLEKSRLFDVDVEVILADDEMIEPYTYDWTLRVEERHRFLRQLHMPEREKIPYEFDDLFGESNLTPRKDKRAANGEDSDQEERRRGSVHVTDCRLTHSVHQLGHFVPRDSTASAITAMGSRSDRPSPPRIDAVQSEDGFTGDSRWQERSGTPTLTPPAGDNAEALMKLNQIIYNRSKKAQLVVLNLPDLWGADDKDTNGFMSYCENLTIGLEQVLFVHSSGHELFEILA